MINCCVYGVPPSSVYKGREEERAGQGEEARPWGAILLQVGFPPLSFSPSQVLIQLGKGGVLLPVGVGLLLARPKAGRTSPL